MAALDKAGLLARKSLRRKLVEIGDGESVWMREFSVAERHGLQEKYKPTPENPMYGSLAVVAVALQNEDGSPMFAENEIDEAVQVLSEGSEATVAVMLAAMQGLNGLGEGALKEALGKSEPTPSASSS